MEPCGRRSRTRRGEIWTAATTLDPDQRASFATCCSFSTVPDAQDFGAPAAGRDADGSGEHVRARVCAAARPPHRGIATLSAPSPRLLPSETTRRRRSSCMQMIAAGSSAPAGIPGHAVAARRRDAALGPAGACRAGAFACTRWILAGLPVRHEAQTASPQRGSPRAGAGGAARGKITFHQRRWGTAAVSTTWAFRRAASPLQSGRVAGLTPKSPRSTRGEAMRIAPVRLAVSSPSDE